MSATTGNPAVAEDGSLSEEGPEIGHDEPAVPISRITYRAHVPTAALVSFALVIFATVLIVGAMDSAQQILGLAGLALVTSAVVTPAVERFGRIIGPAAAALVLHLVLLVAFAAGTAVVLQNITVQAAALEEYATAQLDEFDDGAPGLLTRANISQRLGEAATSWGTNAVVGDDRAVAIAARLSQLLIVVVLSVFFTLSRHRLLDIAMGWLDNRDRRRVAREIWTDSVGSRG